MFGRAVTNEPITTQEKPGETDWDIVANNDEFKALMAAKVRFVVPMTIFFIVYYFALPVLVGYAPEFMSTPVLGPVNIAYLFALSAVLYGLGNRLALSTQSRAARPDGPQCPGTFAAAKKRRRLLSLPLLMFLAFIAITLGITWWASKRSSGASGFFAAGRNITAWQNGIAVAGDYMSAASFLGIAGIIAFQGYDGFMYSVGWLVAYLTVLLIVAEPLRNAGKYTMADLLAYRLRAKPVRAMASISTLTVSTFYMIAQMVAAGTLVALLLKDSGISYNAAVIMVGLLMVAYVAFGGMLATTWVQIVKAVLLMSGTILLASFLVMKNFHFSFNEFFTAVTQVQDGDKVVNFLKPGLRYKPPYGALDLISLGLALIFGTAGLPHILVRFYTVPDAKTARHSVVWAMAIIGAFFIMTTFLGFGAATIVGKAFIGTHGGINMSAPLLAQRLAGDVFFAFISAVAFATILAVVAGLTISASTSFAHDLYANVIRAGQPADPRQEVRVARITSFVVGAVSIAIAIILGPTFNVAFLVGLAFAVAASANLPVILLSIFWKRFTTEGAVWGLATGLLSALALIIISPSIMGVDGPGVAATARHLIPVAAGLSSGESRNCQHPLGFFGAWFGTVASARDNAAEHKVHRTRSSRQYRSSAPKRPPRTNDALCCFGVGFYTGAAPEKQALILRIERLP